jgi:uracil-DNA glycosylase family 4
LRAWSDLERRIVGCTLCPRLRAHCETVAREKRAAYRDQEYWGRPVPGFGDPEARLVLVGLAPGAHGANRTGRMFTGDSSGDWLFEALHRFGFANRPRSVDRKDGLRLQDAYITAACRCAPPGNRPTAGEIANCRPYMARELELLSRARLFLALGRIGFDALVRMLREREELGPGRKPPFSHGSESRLSSGRLVLASYHPSRQNTQTGRLTRAMFHRVFRRARRVLDGEDGGPRGSFTDSS